MRKLNIFLLFMSLLIVGQLAKAQEIKGRLKIEAQESEYKTARPYLFEFILYPVGEKTINELDSVVKTGKFLKYFYVFDISEKRFSENNQDVFVVTGHLIPTEPYRKNEMVPLKVLGRDVYVEIQAPGLTKLEDKIQGLIIQGFPAWEQLKWWQKVLGVIGSGIALYLLVLLGMKLREKYNSAKRKKLLKKTWIENFTNAQTRAEFERLYRNKHEWIDVLGHRNPETINFIKDINEVQFKEEWSKEDFAIIKDSTHSVLKTLEEAQ